MLDFWIKREKKKKKKTRKRKKTVWVGQSVCVCEGVAGRRPATFSQKHGLCPPFGFRQVEKRGLGSRFRVQGCSLGFRVWVWGFKVKGKGVWGLKRKTKRKNKKKKNEDEEEQEQATEKEKEEKKEEKEEKKEEENKKKKRKRNRRNNKINQKKKKKSKHHVFDFGQFRLRPISTSELAEVEDPQLEDDHRNVFPGELTLSCVVEALEQDLCEPAMVPTDPNVEVGRQGNEDNGSGLVPTLLDDVEEDLAVPYTEIDMTVKDSLRSWPILANPILAEIGVWCFGQ